MTPTRPTPRRLLKLIERAQLLRHDIVEMGGDEVDADALGAFRMADELVQRLYAWNDALRATSGQGGAS